MVIVFSLIVYVTYTRIFFSYCCADASLYPVFFSRRSSSVCICKSRYESRECGRDVGCKQDFFFFQTTAKSPSLEFFVTENLYTPTLGECDYICTKCEIPVNGALRLGDASRGNSDCESDTESSREHVMLIQLNSHAVMRDVDVTHPSSMALLLSFHQRIAKFTRIHDARADGRLNQWADGIDGPAPITEQREFLTAPSTSK